jgi:putative ABC transport system substrate-binding protein
MRRRSFITLLGGAAAAWPLAAWAQQRAVQVVGVLSANSVNQNAHSLSAFQQGLAETGFVDGRNLAFEYRFAENQNERLPALAADLVRRQVAVILAQPAAAALALKAATATIPVIFLVGGDPVDQFGLVTSYSRPGGNMTGVTFYTTELYGKRMEQLREIVPTMSVVAMLANPNSPGTARATRSAQEAARALGLQIVILHASTEREIDAAFASLVQRRADALVVQAQPLFNSRRDQIIALAARHAIPATYPDTQDAVVGGLMSYGTSRANFADLHRQSGVYAGRILKGEKPGELPILQPTRFELVVNLKTAKAIGLTIPETFLVRADEVIE